MKRIVLSLLGVLAVLSALSFQLSTTFAQGTPYSFLTFPNPTPAGEDLFGASVAAVGTDRVLIGASGDDTGAANAGTAYLFSTNGVLLTTITNPTPAIDDRFGGSVAAVASDCVLIGASNADIGATNAGAAYLFSTNGTLFTTFTNPTPASGDFFGYSVASVGTDRVLIGAVGDDTSAADAGAAYLFSTNGALLTTITNPTLAISEHFGHSVAAMGTDRVLIGASGDNIGAGHAGGTYLFSTDGALLTTFTNPTPAANDSFGYSFGSPVAAVGIDRVLIGATLAYASGAAYLFSTNGALLTTITNPMPTGFDHFGYSVAALGADRVLIGAPYCNTGAAYAGVAYLFSTNGVLLTTFTNPTPAIYENFGLWPSLSTGWTLQQNTNAGSSVNWSDVPGPIQDDGTNKTFIVNPQAGNRFYRLFKP